MKIHDEVRGAENSSSEIVIDQRLELARRHWRYMPRPEHEPSPPRTSRREVSVAVSREAGSGGSEVAHEIGKRLGWPVYDREILELIAERSVLRSELLESIDEHDRNWLVETLTSFGYPGEISSAGYFHHLTSVLAALSGHGRCVIVGRGATALLPSAMTLRVRVVAPFEQRVQRIAHKQHLSYREAEKKTREIDKERAIFMACHFQRDLNDPHGFDLVLNTARFAPAECADLAVSAVKVAEIGFGVQRHEAREDGSSRVDTASRP